MGLRISGGGPSGPGCAKTLLLNEKPKTMAAAAPRMERCLIFKFVFLFYAVNCVSLPGTSHLQACIK